MDELTLDDKAYLSSKRAAQVTGYAKDYVGQLCREGRVEARLVGRNWYVLESSIREHRFGAETTKKEVFNEVKEPENPIQEAWKASSYVAETTSELPVLIVEPKSEYKSINVISGIPEPKENEALPIVQEMQSAWYDWFSRTNGIQISKETLLEDEETIEEREKASEVLIQEEKNQIEEEETTPILIEKIREPREQPVQESEVVDSGESVQIKRTFEPAQSSVGQNSFPVSISKASPRQQGSIIQERIIRRKKKPSIVLKTLLLSLAGVSIAVALLGSGQFDSYVGTSFKNIAPFHYLVGESSFQKTSK
jgi:hypothetical protein